MTINFGQSMSDVPMIDIDNSGLGEEIHGQWRMALRRFRRDRLAMFGLITFLTILLIATIYTFANPSGWSELTTSYNEAPSWHHLFGTTSSGLDLFSACLKGAQQDVIIAFTVASISMVLGTIAGGVAGYYKGSIDAVIMRFVDLLLVIPLLAILIVLSRIFAGSGNSWWMIAILIGLLSWTYIARLVRAEFLSLRERTFVEAATALGAGARRIIFKHLVPNAIGTIIVNTTLTVSGAMLLESTLSFLGLGIVPPQVSLGMLVQEGQDSATTEPWLFAFPAGMLLVLILCVFFIGDGLQNALDPRKSRSRA